MATTAIHSHITDALNWDCNKSLENQSYRGVAMIFLLSMVLHWDNTTSTYWFDMLSTGWAQIQYKDAMLRV